eukprot:CAMPEP_0114552394 /NCGR_PEP_ID=MMETSP0114-20121206/7102_1 /TAXON_ID=31324 /ORGANISM="Goniomonas sp, Strain m" /LENGTH=539 /DNA_ID=CAMNT_0001737269 /DNA_START=8 /DNA_END=1627 /DNA_ORIENTATION=-
MAKLVECVPNFSEGRDKSVLDAIADAIRKVQGCSLLDVDPGASTNRTVFTFVGSPDAVIEGALAGARVAHKLIDMRGHKGAHVRFGAMDVCPFVPVANVTMEECVECAKKCGQRLAEELDIPVYLYEAASSRDYRKALVQIRAGEYEAIPSRIGTPEWKPDFGPAEFRPKWGATAVGARDFLIAYNVNLLGTKEQAHRIALNIRDNGRSPAEPGRCKKVKGMGWYVDEYNLAQMTFNLDDFHVTPPHVVFEECVKDARELGLAVMGSELVGLVPLEALLTASAFYEKQENLFLVDERQRVQLAVHRLGLASCSPFDIDKRVIEYAIEKPARPLVSSSLNDFIRNVGSRTSAPGGGSAAAAIAAMGAGLGAMMGWMSYGSRKFEHLDGQMRQNIPPLDSAMKALIEFVDEDTHAFEGFMTAMRLPKDTPEQAAARSQAMENGLKHAVNVPLRVMRCGDTCWGAMIEMAKVGNLNSRSDLEVGAKALETGIWGAHRNVLINLADIKDEEFKQSVTAEAALLMDRARANLNTVVETLEMRTN